METPSQLFVSSVYHDLLGRTADAAGLNHWSSAIDQGQPRYVIALSFTASVEYRADQVQAAYQYLLHRPVDGSPDSGGEGYWVDYIGRGATYEQLVESIIGSDEFFFSRGGGTVDGYITAVYTDILGRTPEPSGLSFWDAELNSGTPRWIVANALVQSLEATQTRVRSWYDGGAAGAFLHRAADAAGLDHWVNQLFSGVTDQNVIASLIATQEYFAHANSH